eukprot:9551396-Lingulodinium_polyedra.AAC.1
MQQERGRSCSRASHYTPGCASRQLSLSCEGVRGSTPRQRRKSSHPYGSETTWVDTSTTGRSISASCSTRWTC